MSNALEKTQNVAKHFLTIYAVMAIIASGLVFAGDVYHEKFLKVETFNSVMEQQTVDRAKEAIVKEIKQLNNEIRDLKIERKYATKNRDKLRIDEKILTKETAIKNLKVE